MLIQTIDFNRSISPSVYVAYRDLVASYNCPSFGIGDFTLGRAYNTTIAYNPGFLSTSMCTGTPEGGYQGYAALNLTKLQHPTSYNGSCLGLDIMVEHTTNGPYLSMPPNLASLDPAWSACDVVYWGAFDPPIALHTATALVQDPGKNSLPTAAPGSPVLPPHAPATPTAPHVDPGKPETHSPTPNPGPEDPEQHDPNKSSANDPKIEDQDPAGQKSDPPDPVNSKNPEVVSDPQFNDPQAGGTTSKGDPETDPSNEHNAGLASNLIPPLDQPSTDQAQPLPSIGGQKIQAANGGGIIIASNTLRPGAQTTIDSTPISVDKDAIIIASSTIPLIPQSADPILTLVNGDIITAGGQAATASGTTVAFLAPNDDALVVNGITSPLPLPPISILSVAGQTFTPAPTGFAIGTQRLLPGGPPVLFAGSTFSLASESNALIVNGKTTPLASSAPISVFEIGSQTFTAGPTGFQIGTLQISPGGDAKMVDGTLVSLGSKELVIGTSTMPLGSAAQATEGALASLIMGGFGDGAGPMNGSSKGSSVVAFTGDGNVMSRVGFGTVILALNANVCAAAVALGLLW